MNSGGVLTLRRCCPALLWLALCLLPACGGGDSDDHLERGELFLAQGQLEEARLEGIYVLRRQPGRPEALWLVGRSLLALERDGEAEGYLRSLLDEAPGYREPAAALYDSLARRDYREGRRERAAERWERALVFHPDRDLGPYAFFVARHFFERRDWPSSTRLYLRATEAWPDSSAVDEALLPLAQGLVRLGHWEEAREQLERFLRLAPRHAQRSEAIFLYQDVLLRLARADHELLDLQGALEKLDEALRFRVNPGMIEEALLERGRCLEELGRYGEAAESYRRLIESSGSGRGRAVEAALERLETLEKARLK